jgi:hypothetical protein
MEEVQMKTTNRFPSFQVPESVLDKVQDAVEIAQNGAASLENKLRGIASDAFETSSAPRISSLVEKYKGPDSIELPQRSSRVDQYQGPDSLKRPEIESQVEKYKGPKSLFDERGSRVEKYKGPDSAGRQIFILPRATADIIADLQNADDSFSSLIKHEDK